jgi:predicted membrane protein
MSNQRSNDGRMTWGLIIIGFGVLFLLDNLDVLDFGDVIHDYWPLILVLIGFRMILNRSRSKESSQPATSGESVNFSAESAHTDKSTPRNTSAQQSFSESRFIGDTWLKVTSDDFTGGNASSFIGDTHLDFSEVTVKSGERTVHVSGFIGDVKIAPPKKVPFMLNVNTTIGDIRIFENTYEGLVQSRVYKSPDYDAAAARMRIHVSKFIGDVTCW